MRIVRLIGTGALLLVAWLSRHAGDRWFYRPDAVDHGTPESYGLDVVEVRFGTERAHAAQLAGACRGRAPRARSSTRMAIMPTSHHARFVAWLPRRGYDLLLFDYRGFGKSAGTVSRAGTVADTIAAIDFALARDGERTFVFGHSLGGALAIVAAASRPAVRAVVVESTFPSYRAAARRTVPWLGALATWLVSPGFDPADVIDQISPRPLLIIHGASDHITPVELGKKLFAAACEPKRLWIVEGAAHESAWVRERRAFETEILSFFAAAPASAAR
ncbi:MAG: alpha/beta fold hydrolase [Planctomycetota bacterium]